MIPKNTRKQNNETCDEEKNQNVETESKLTQILAFTDKDIKSYYCISYDQKVNSRRVQYENIKSKLEIKTRVSEININICIYITCSIYFYI